ncbi:hypothetical protein HFX_6194 (plasmid) [Haloferax mediterranei ATCC 33500]|uniref:Uncharacterized protein n=1 Tax=Haloferax mediterranei (strain ATCC 33500 / DSM 1411 / JCM 8866 / NBRC 14739 / NCIMB 2177 / R-4) TaxID=523841 RepID=I3RAQ7_HALMT|nr:hypothetical protein HFX_6194 [Haloferax mediterranei ATCC 33500]
MIHCRRIWSDFIIFDHVETAVAEESVTDRNLSVAVRRYGWSPNLHKQAASLGIHCVSSLTATETVPYLTSVSLERGPADMRFPNEAFQYGW